MANPIDNTGFKTAGQISDPLVKVGGGPLMFSEHLRGGGISRWKIADLTSDAIDYAAISEGQIIWVEDHDNGSGNSPGAYYNYVRTDVDTAITRDGNGVVSGGTWTLLSFGEEPTIPDGLNVVNGTGDITLGLEESDGTPFTKTVKLEGVTGSGITVIGSTDNIAHNFNHLTNEELRLDLESLQGKVLNVYNQFTGTSNTYTDSTKWTNVFSVRSDKYGESISASGEYLLNPFYRIHDRTFRLWITLAAGTNAPRTAYDSVVNGDRIGLAFTAAAFDASQAADNFPNVYNFTVASKGQYQVLHNDGKDVRYIDFHLDGDADEADAFSAALLDRSDPGENVRFDDENVYYFWSGFGLFSNVREHDVSNTLAINGDQLEALISLEKIGDTDPDGNVLRIGPDNTFVSEDARILVRPALILSGGFTLLDTTTVPGSLTAIANADYYIDTNGRVGPVGLYYIFSNDAVGLDADTWYTLNTVTGDTDPIVGF